MSNLPVLIQSTRYAVDPVSVDEGLVKKGFKWVFGKLRKIAKKKLSKMAAQQRKGPSASRAPAGRKRTKKGVAQARPRPRARVKSQTTAAKRKIVKAGAARAEKQRTTQKTRQAKKKAAAKQKTDELLKRMNKGAQKKAEKRVAVKEKPEKKPAAKKQSKAEFAKKREKYMKEKPWEKKAEPSDLDKKISTAKKAADKEAAEKKKAHKERMAASKKRIATYKKQTKAYFQARKKLQKISKAAKKVSKQAKGEETTMSLSTLIEGARTAALQENALKAFGTTEQELFDYLKGPHSKRVTVSELVYAFGGEPTSWATALKKLVDAGKLGRTFNKKVKTYVYHLPVGGKASPEIKNAIKKWVDKWNAVAKKTEYYLKVGVDYRRTNILIYTFDSTGRSALYFVDPATGDLLRPDGWKKPSKNVHGSIFKTDPADVLKARGAFLKKKPPAPTPTPVNPGQQPTKAPVGSPPKPKVPHFRLIKGGRWGEQIERLRELMGEATVKKAAVPMDAEGFMAEVKKQARIKDRQLRISHGALSSIRKNQLFVNFVNLPQGIGGAGGGAEAENNRWMCSVNGFDNDGGPPPNGKVKLEIHISYGFPKMRGKTGTPQQVAKAIAAQLTKIVKEVEPKYTHTKREDLEESMQSKKWYKMHLSFDDEDIYFYAVAPTKSGGFSGMQVSAPHGKARGKAIKTTVTKFDFRVYKEVPEGEVPARAKQKVQDRIGDFSFAPKPVVSKPNPTLKPTGPLTDKERGALKVILGYKAFARAEYMKRHAPGVEYSHEDPTIRGLEARGLLKINKMGSIQAIRAKAEKAMKESLDEAAKPVGKIQTAVLAYVKKHASKAEPLEITDIARTPELRGVNFGKIQNAVGQLIKKGLLKQATGPESGKQTAVEGSDDMTNEGCGSKLHKLSKKSKKKKDDEMEMESVDYTTTNVSLDRIRVELEDKVLAAEGVELDELSAVKRARRSGVAGSRVAKMAKSIHRREAAAAMKKRQKRGKVRSMLAKPSGGEEKSKLKPGEKMVFGRKVKAEDTDLDEAKKKKSMEPGGGGRFAKLKAQIAKKGDVSDPGAVAAAIGRKKYGKKKFQQMAAKGRARASGG